MKHNFEQANLEILNTDGCGVCKYISWDIIEEKKERLLSRFWKTIRNIFQKEKLAIQENIKLKPFCTKHKKFMLPIEICDDYSGKKQVKFFGTKKDIDIQLDKRLMY